MQPRFLARNSEREYNCGLVWDMINEGLLYSGAVWRFNPFLSVGLRLLSYLSGGLRSINYWRFRS